MLASDTLLQGCYCIRRQGNRCMIQSEFKDVGGVYNGTPNAAVSGSRSASRVQIAAPGVV